MHSMIRVMAFCKQTAIYHAAKWFYWVEFLHRLHLPSFGSLAFAIKLYFIRSPSCLQLIPPLFTACLLYFSICFGAKMMICWASAQFYCNTQNKQQQFHDLRNNQMENSFSRWALEKIECCRWILNWKCPSNLIFCYDLCYCYQTRPSL